MSGLLTRFLSSKAVTLLLLATVAGAGWYVYSQGKALGELERKAEQLSKEAAEAQEARDAKQRALKEQSAELQKLRKEGREQKEELREELQDTSEEFRRCFNTPVPDSLRQ